MLQTKQKKDPSRIFESIRPFMHYYIDGYNLLFRIVKASDEDLQKQREQIIDDLGRKINHLNIDATIVFDSYYQKGMRERSFKHNVEILFTDEGETADECILDELRTKRNPRLETVVTSDKKLAWQSRLKGAHTLSVEDFLSCLNQRWRKKIQPSKIEKKEPEPIIIPEKKETVEEFYLKSFEDALAGDPFFKKEREKKEKRKSDYERWLDAFEEK